MIMKTTGRYPMAGDAAPAPSDDSTGGEKKMKVGKMLVIGLFIALVLSLGVNYFFQKRLSDLKQNPQKLNQEEIDQLVEEIGQIIILPAGEQPVVATVADLARLQDQPFFAKAKVGDKVLLYTQSRKAILYDPVEKKIVEVAPINIGGTPEVQ